MEPARQRRVRHAHARGELTVQRGAIWVGMLALLALIVQQSVFVIDPTKQAIVLRFGFERLLEAHVPFHVALALGHGVREGGAGREPYGNGADDGDAGDQVGCRR